jgi:hypothetical protein
MIIEIGTSSILILGLSLCSNLEEGIAMPTVPTKTHKPDNYQSKPA